MTIHISRVQKIRLISFIGFTILLLLLLTFISSNNNINNENNNNYFISQNNIQKISTRFSSDPRIFRKSNTTQAPLLEICQAINARHEPYPIVSQHFHHKNFPCDNIITSSSVTPPHFAQHGNFWALNNFIKAKKTYRCDESITYTTHSEYSYLMDNLVPLLKRWNGPVSLSIYIPGSDFFEALRRILYLRECSPDSKLVQDYLSVHLFFDHGNLPQQLSPDFEAIIFSSLNIPFPCWDNPIFTNFSKDGATSYRRSKKLPYPINVGRNIAKEMAVTKYVLPSDIELYPSPGLIPDFLEMIKRSENSQNNNDEGDSQRRKVYVLPIFESDGSLSTDQLPQNKRELVFMLKKKLAVPFHYRICPLCHKIPKAAEWMAAPPSEGLNVFHVTNRTGDQAHWEPIYIGTKDEPGYDERLNWEGLKDKMSQGSILCILDYEMHILDNAFLIHSPGIKSKGPSTDAGRKQFIAKQSQVVSKQIHPELKLLYGERPGCH